jgi:hypothetical protein
MSDELDHIELKLTPDQQARIQRLSGQHAQVLQLTLSPDNHTEGAGRALQFRWRLSTASGIPHQQWDSDAGESPGP